MKPNAIHPREGGATMVLVLLVLVALTLILFAAIYLTRTDTMVAGNLRFRAEAAQSAAGAYQSVLAATISFHNNNVALWDNNSGYLPTIGSTQGSVAGNPCTVGTANANGCCYAPSSGQTVSSLSQSISTGLWCTGPTTNGFGTFYAIMTTGDPNGTITTMPSVGTPMNMGGGSFGPITQQMYYYIFLVAGVDPNASHTEVIQSYTVALPAQ